MFRRKPGEIERRGARWRNGAPCEPDARDYATILMLTAVASAAGNIATALIELGRTAGWWH